MILVDEYVFIVWTLIRISLQFTLAYVVLAVFVRGIALLSRIKV